MNKANEDTNRSPAILLGQQGYEGALVNLGLLKPGRFVPIFEYRRNRYLLILSILRVLGLVVALRLQRRPCSIMISSREGDEVLAILWLGILKFGLKAEFWLLEINNREDAFRPVDASEVVLGRRTRKILALLTLRVTGSVSYQRNDVGQASYVLNLPVSQYVQLPARSWDAHEIGEIQRLLILLEPERSREVIDETRWIQCMSDIARYARRRYPGVEVMLKAHPYQESWSLDILGSQTLPKQTNIFDFLRTTDWVVGTFSNVIDVAPKICRTTSVFEKVAKIPVPSDIQQRIRRSGCEIR